MRTVLKKKAVVVVFTLLLDHQGSLVVKQVSDVDKIEHIILWCNFTESESGENTKEESSEESSSEEESSSSTDAGEVLANLKQKFSKKPQRKSTIVPVNWLCRDNNVFTESESESSSTEESTSEESESEESDEPAHPQSRKQKVITILFYNWPLHNC